MRRDLEERLYALATKQGGVVTQAQLQELGVGSRTVRRSVDTGAWCWLNRRVLKVSLGAPGLEQRELAGQFAMGDGAVLSHLTAARRLGLDVPRDSEVHVTVPAERRVARVDGVRLWRSRDLRPDDWYQSGPFRQTRLGRTVVDLTQVLEDRWLRAVVDSALRLRPSNRKWLELALEQHGRGRRGAERLRDLLDAQTHGEEVSDSALESFAMELGLATGRKPRLHLRIPTLIGALEVDLAWPEVRLAVEFDGYRNHCTRQAFGRDRERDRALVAAHWVVLRYVWSDATGARQRCIDELASAWRRCARTLQAG